MRNVYLMNTILGADGKKKLLFYFVRLLTPTTTTISAQDDGTTRPPFLHNGHVSINNLHTNKKSRRWHRTWHFLHFRSRCLSECPRTIESLSCQKQKFHESITLITTTLAMGCHITVININISDGAKHVQTNSPVGDLINISICF